MKTSGNKDVEQFVDMLNKSNLEVEERSKEIERLQAENRKLKDISMTLDSSCEEFMQLTEAKRREVDELRCQNTVSLFLHW